MTVCRWVIVALAGAGCLGATPGAAPQRPAGTGGGEADAKVVWAKGKATVKPFTGAEFPAADGLPLFRTDELAAPRGGFVLVELKNGYLARIDEEISLKVGEIALFGAPKAADDSEAQLARLLSQAELKEAGQRVVGYRAGMRAADSAPAAAESKAFVIERKKERAPAPPPPAAPAPPPVEAPTFKDRVASEGDAPGRGGADFKPEIFDRPTKGGLPQAGAASVAKAPKAKKMLKDATRWALLEKGTERAQGALLPAAIDAAVTAPGFYTCVSGELSRLGAPAFGPVKLLLRVADQKIALVRLAGIAAPACDAGALNGLAVPEIKKNVWVVVEVPEP